MAMDEIERLKKELKAMQEQALRYAEDLAKIFKKRKKEIKLLDLTQKQLIRSARMAMIGQLAASVAHELNNILMPAIGNVELIMMQKDKLDPKLLEKIIRIKAALDKSSLMLRQLLDFSRGTIEKKHKVDLNDLIASTLDFLEHKLKKQNIKVETKFNNLPKILADANQLEQVFTNIVINAIEAMNNGGTLKIKTKFISSQNCIEVSFKDTGSGISPEHLDHIFEPFYTTKEKGEGTGLGLFVSYGIIERHGGSIDVTSELNKGSTFTIRLPVTIE